EVEHLPYRGGSASLRFRLVSRCGDQRRCAQPERKQLHPSVGSQTAHFGGSLETNNTVANRPNRAAKPNSQPSVASSSVTFAEPVRTASIVLTISRYDNSFKPTKSKSKFETW